MCCSPPVRTAVHFVRYVVAIFLEQVIVWIVLVLHPHPCELSRDFLLGKRLREKAKVNDRYN